jgi:hypothetical protein
MNERVTVTIVLEPDGKVNVNGPLSDKVLMYGLLGLAHDLVKDFKQPTPNTPGAFGRNPRA